MAAHRVIPAAHQLLLMACSQRKRDSAGGALPALDLYQGVMYQTLRTHGVPHAMPQLVILSAEHGFLQPDETICSYDRRMDRRRAEQLLHELPDQLNRLQHLQGVRAVMLCGGALYRLVMAAAIDALKRNGQVVANAPVEACAGQLGEQRAQLGAYLRNLARPAAAA